MEHPTAPDFATALEAHGLAGLRRLAPTTLQVNVGKRCNQACHHCHVDAGPKRTEVMTDAVVERVRRRCSSAHPSIALLDVTGGAPELASVLPRARVARARGSAARVIDPLQPDGAAGAGHRRIWPRSSPPTASRSSARCRATAPENVDAQRGAGVFEKSIRALRALNALGYGAAGRALRLDLVYNPVGALPAAAAGRARGATTASWLLAQFGIVFHRLLTITNMPITRFARSWLARAGKLRRATWRCLVNHFNPATVDGLMCRTLVSVGYDGRLYDCDFNQMLELPLGARACAHDLGRRRPDGARRRAPCATGPHCFGCTAGAGSSCGGVLA